MALEPAAGEVMGKLRWRLTADPEEMICTIGLRPHDPQAFDDLNDVARRLYKAWAGAWEQDTLSNQWALVGAEVAGGDANNGAQGQWNEILGGNTVAGPLPQNCAMLVQKKTGSAGRKNSGRMFLPSGYLFEEQVSATGVIDSAELTSRQGNMNQFYDNIRDDTQLFDGNAVGVEPILFHSDASPATLITSFVVAPVIATQRQRLRR